MTIHESARTIPVTREVDVLVCGGGPAGVAAAVAAGRAGARVQLLEAAGCLGGIWTTGLMPWVIDYRNKTGLMAEIDACMRRKPRSIAVAPNRSGYDPERVKHGLERLCLDAKAMIRLHTRVCGAVVEDGRITAVLTESKSGREAWQAKVCIDATGDGDLAASAGCGFDYGRPGTQGEAQPMSFIALLAGLRVEDVGERFTNLGQADWSASKDALKAEMEQGGVSPSYAKPTLFHVYDDLFLLMANHQYGVSGLKAEDLTRATLEGRSEVNRLVDALRSRGGVWKDIVLVGTSAHIGVREGRHIHGRYTVTADDVRRGARFDDAICRATFCVDIHSTAPRKDKGLGNGGVQAQPYDIPLRSLIARDLDNLMMAGRCISGDFFAHASYRVTGNAVAMGEAAGHHAALAAGQNRPPADVPFAPTCGAARTTPL